MVVSEPLAMYLHGAIKYNEYFAAKLDDMPVDLFIPGECEETLTAIFEHQKTCADAGDEECLQPENAARLAELRSALPPIMMDISNILDDINWTEDADEDDDGVEDDFDTKLQEARPIIIRLKN